MNSAASETSPTDSAVAMNAGIERLKDDGKHDTDVATEVVTLASKDAGPPEQPAYSPLRKSLAIAGLTISLMLVALDATLVTTAVPTMAKELGGFDTYSWIGSCVSKTHVGGLRD